MQCRDCGTNVSGEAATCPACGSDGTREGARRLRPDGGTEDAPTRDPDVAGEDGSSAGGPADRKPQGPSGDLTASERLRAVADRLPLAAGGFIGAVALLVPYVLITVVTFVAADRGDALGTAADMFFTILAFGPGERFVDGFISVAAITSLATVRPADYPSLQAELEAAIDILQSQPEAALLLLYVAGPWILYLGGRYLARHHATDETPAAHAIAGATVGVGTLPVVAVLGVVFGPPNVATTIVLFGVVVPLALGAVGGLSVYVFRRETAWTSKATGWLGVGLGILATFVLSPWLPFPLDLAQRASIGAMGFLAAASLDVALEPLTVLILALVALGAVLAGYLRARLARDDIESWIDGVRVGTSAVLGYVGAVALLGAVLPLSRILIGLPGGATGAFATVQPSLVGYLRIVLVGGVVFPTVCCAVGGYLVARGALPDGATPV